MRVYCFEILEPLFVDPFNVVYNFNIVGNLIIDYPAVIDYQIVSELHLVVMAESTVIFVPAQVVKLVYIKTIALVCDYLIHPLAILVVDRHLTFNQSADKICIQTIFSGSREQVSMRCLNIISEASSCSQLPI